MRQQLLGGLLGLVSVSALAQWEISAQWRGQWDDQQVGQRGPMAQANALVPGQFERPGGGATLQAEVRANAPWVRSMLTLQAQRSEAQSSSSQARLNELEFPFEFKGWLGSLGKKVVSWDVGYGFRPNDMVQQEERRTLVSAALEGRPMLLLEHFSAQRAWSWVLVNPTHDAAQRGVQEPALAARLYQRDGAVDWHGFARVGAHTGASVGAAFASVIGEAWAWHGSWRIQRRVDSRRLQVDADLMASSPWRDSELENVQQVLFGGSWTSANQVSVLAEFWWDGSAVSDAQWQAWAQRNQMLWALAGAGAPKSVVAGNLAWQADALGLNTNLRRRNVFLRASWQTGAWTSALDGLFTPADGGRLLSASLAWQGDRVLWQGGLRVSAGPAEALLQQLPRGPQAYVTTTWSF